MRPFFIKSIRDSPDVHVHSDKTGNLYRMNTDTYQRFIRNAMTSNYEKTGELALTNINVAGQEITTKLGVSD